MRVSFCLYIAAAAASLLVARAQRQISLSCPDNYERMNYDTCQCMAEPDEPCPDGLGWDPNRCECQSVPEQVCTKTCPPGATIQQDCECHTDDCSSLSATDCESVKCAADSYCGLGKKTSISIPGEPPRVFCSGCGCCSTARLQDDLHLMRGLGEDDMLPVARTNEECSGSPCGNIQGP